MSDRNRWIAHIKELRSTHGLSLPEAERMALSDPQWRRWVTNQINADQACRKMALSHIKIHGADALLTKDGEVLRVR